MTIQVLPAKPPESYYGHSIEVFGQEVTEVCCPLQPTTTIPGSPSGVDNTLLESIIYFSEVWKARK
jgi:hypothetical protein